MKVSSISIKNVLGIREMAIDPGSITVVSGPNGTGKSSFIKAMQNVIGGGSLSEIKNLDAGEDEKPEIAITLDDDELGTVLVRKRENGVSVKKQVGDTAGFENVPKPQQFLKAMFDAKLANPIEFIRCRDKDRVQLLLEALDLEYDRGDLWSQMGLSIDDFDPVPEGLHPLIEIGLHRQSIFRERTGVNRDEKEKRSTCEQTRRTVPAEIPDIGDVQILADEVDLMKSEREKRKAEFDRARDDGFGKLANDEEALAIKVVAEFNEYEERLKREMAEKLSTKRNELQKQRDNLREDNDKKRVELDAKHRAAMDKIQMVDIEIAEKSAKLAEMREQEKSAVRIKTLHDQANRFEREADELSKSSQMLSDALEILDTYKASMCQNLPIVGLEITDNVVRVNGVPWEQLNTAQQVTIAVKVSCLRFKNEKFKPVWIDGAEALDSDSFKALCDELEFAGAQAFIGKVQDGDFNVKKLR